ncbi:MAG: S53 family peptidase [Alphaproteobacteria bacterium]|nr:S53 family peptidase [Alphaproteobacteria bacterium]MBV9063142.1 S53 family peptidase [Alphaproteobacteria bacterium]
MRHVLAAGVMPAIAALSLSASAYALSGPVMLSGTTYHRAACAQTVGHVARCHAHVVTDKKGGTKIFTLPSGYGPSDLRSAYNITTNGSSSAIVAIVDAYGYNNAESDLGVYRSTYGLPSCTTGNGCFKKLNQSGQQGNYPAQNTGWAQESALDLDMASAACPACKIYLIEATSASYSNLATAVNTAAAQGAHAISNSYGGGESGTTGYESAYNHAGIAITVSSGDSGYGVQFPASSPHVTAVGGTHLVKASNSRGWTETVWSGAGSGCSSVYAKPSWQHDSGCSKRTVADVSAVADPNTGVAVYGPVTSRRSGWLVFGGTSVAAPLIAGIYGNNGGAVNYGSDPYNNTGALFDVTSGSNGSCGGSYLCTGTAGYDGPTGLGTPNGTGAF